jgi:hypothetical protein
MEVTIRPVEPRDADLFNDWVNRIKDLNLFDPAVMEYPGTNTLAVDINGEPALYFPFHPVIAGESLAPKPGLTPREEAVALKKLQEGLVNIAKGLGIREIYFVCKDESLGKFVEHYGYEHLPWNLYRLRVPALTQDEIDSGQLKTEVKKVR